MLKSIGAAAIALPLVLATGDAFAQQSTYTTVELSACSQAPVNPKDELASGLWRCRGYAGIPVMIAESDLRFFVSYGANAANEPAMSQTLPPFNYINDTLEWRLDQAATPYATILRFFTDTGDGGERQILVVTRLGDAACHIAYVDALANSNANELARQAADLFARSFSCDVNSAIWIGAGGLY